MWPFEQSTWPYWLSAELVILVCGPLSLILYWIEVYLGHIALYVAVVVTAVIVAVAAILLYIHIMAMMCPPRIQLTNVAGPANVMDDDKRGVLKQLQQRSEILLDVFGSLARSDLDVCQLVSRIWRNTVDENTKELPLEQLDVTLVITGGHLPNFSNFPRSI